MEELIKLDELDKLEELVKMEEFSHISCRNRGDLICLRYGSFAFFA